MRFIGSSVVNMLLFDLLWLLLVAGRENWLWLTIPLVLGYVGLLLAGGHLQVRQLLPVVLIGVSIDTLLRLSGLFQFDSSFWPLPVWLILLWFMFATTLPLSLRLLGKRSYFAALAGGLGFPFSYGIGERLGAVSFGVSPLWVLGVLALIWALLLPLLFRLANRREVPCEVH